MKYKYGDINDAKPGDIVESTSDYSIHDKPIGALSIILGIEDDCVVINDKRGKSEYLFDYVKLVKTKPGSKAKVGDTCIRTKIACSSSSNIQQGDTFEVIKINSALVSTDKGITQYPSNFVVLYTEQDEANEPKFTYPMWFKLDSGLVIKFKSINSGTVAVKGKGTYDVGSFRSMIDPHTNSSWTQVDKSNSIPKYKIGDKFLTSFKHSFIDDKIVTITSINDYRYNYENDSDEKGWDSFESVESIDGHFKPYNPNEVKLHRHISDSMKLILRDLYKQHHYRPYIPFSIPARKHSVSPHLHMLAADFTAHTPNNKDNTMDNISISMTAKEYKKYLKLNKPEIEQTELESAKKHLTQWFKPDGHRYSYPQYQTAKQAAKELQRPDRIGWTFRTYTLSASESTDIPTKSLL